MSSHREAFVNVLVSVDVIFVLFTFTDLLVGLSTQDRYLGGWNTISVGVICRVRRSPRQDPVTTNAIVSIGQAITVGVMVIILAGITHVITIEILLITVGDAAAIILKIDDSVAVGIFCGRAGQPSPPSATAWSGLARWGSCPVHSNPSPSSPPDTENWGLSGIRKWAVVKGCNTIHVEITEGESLALTRHRRCRRLLRLWWNRPVTGSSQSSTGHHRYPSKSGGHFAVHRDRAAQVGDVWTIVICTNSVAVGSSHQEHLRRRDRQCRHCLISLAVKISGQLSHAFQCHRHLHH